MTVLKGKKLRKGELSHQWVEDLLYFDGPLLSLLKGSTSQDYFYYFVEQGPMANRWLAFAVSRSSIHDYLARHQTLRDLVEAQDSVYIVDVDDSGEVILAIESFTSDVPEKYFPPVDSLFDSELSP
ncbi:MAG: hypothetical protein AAGM16_08520 [Pseudomonadota bacterium]